MVSVIQGVGGWSISKNRSGAVSNVLRVRPYRRLTECNEDCTLWNAILSFLRVFILKPYSHSIIGFLPHWYVIFKPLYIGDGPSASTGILKFIAARTQFNRARQISQLSKLSRSSWEINCQIITGWSTSGSHSPRNYYSMHSSIPLIEFPSH